MNMLQTGEKDNVLLKCTQSEIQVAQGPLLRG